MPMSGGPNADGGPPRVGLGDQLLGSGMARGAASRGRKVAFGDRKKIIWDKNSLEIFRGNPNIARPGAERDANVQWVEFYKGHRLYNRQDRDRWIWNMEFTPTPGEVFFDRTEIKNGRRYGEHFVLIEPGVPVWKSAAANKDWGRANYQKVAERLRKEGFRVAQFRFDRGAEPLTGVDVFRTLNFRDALAIMSHAALYIGPEGGLHHGAAAVGINAVVLFGGFIPPSVTGYANHANLTGGAEACGSLRPCKHCKDAMARIGVDEVLSAANERLKVENV